MNKIKNRLKALIMGAILVAASEGAWGVEVVGPELFPRGTLSWGTSWLSLKKGKFHVPLNAYICTEKKPLYDSSRPILAVIHLNPPSAYTEMDSADSTLNADKAARNRERGVFEWARLPCGLNDKANRPSRLFVAAVFQYYPMDPEGCILLRPELAISPVLDIPARDLFLTRLKLGELYKNGAKIESFGPFKWDQPAMLGLDNTSFESLHSLAEKFLPLFGPQFPSCALDLSTDTISFSVYMQCGNSNDKDSVGILTYITLVPTPSADKIKRAFQVAALHSQADQYFSMFSSLYKTNLTSAATFADNLNSLIASNGIGETSNEDRCSDLENLKVKWETIYERNPLAKVLENLQEKCQGPRVVTDFFLRAKATFDGERSEDDYSKNPNGAGASNVYKNLHNTFYNLFRK